MASAAAPPPAPAVLAALQRAGVACSTWCVVSSSFPFVPALIILWQLRRSLILLRRAPHRPSCRAAARMGTARRRHAEHHARLDDALWHTHPRRQRPARLGARRRRRGDGGGRRAARAAGAAHGCCHACLGAAAAAGAAAGVHRGSMARRAPHTQSLDGLECAGAARARRTDERHALPALDGPVAADAAQRRRGGAVARGRDAGAQAAAAGRRGEDGVALHGRRVALYVAFFPPHSPLVAIPNID
jgi:hypothetical protein